MKMAKVLRWIYFFWKKRKREVD